MANSGTAPVEDTGMLAEIEVTAKRLTSTLSSPTTTQVLQAQDIAQMYASNLQVVGKLQVGLSLGIRYNFTGIEDSIDVNYRTPAVAYQLEDAKGDKYRVYFPNSVSGVWEASAAEQKFNAFDTIRLTGFAFCGGKKSYIQYNNGSGSSLSQNTVLQYDSTPVSGGRANLEPRASSARPDGVAAFNIYGGSTTSSSGTAAVGYALTSGNWLVNIAAAAGAAVGVSATGSTIVTSPTVQIGSSFRDRESSPSGAADWALLGLNLKTGFGVGYGL